MALSPAEYAKARWLSMQRAEMDERTKTQRSPEDLPSVDELLKQADAPNPDETLRNYGMDKPAEAIGAWRGLIDGLGKAAVGIKTGVGKGLSAFQLGGEKVDSTNNAFRDVILYAGRRYTKDEFKTQVTEALSGHSKMTNDEFSKILVEKATWDAMGHMNLGRWLAAATNPAMALANIPFDKDPKLSVADAFSFATDFWASPYAWLSMAPTKGPINTAVNKAGLPFKFVMDGVDNLIGPAKSGPLSAWNLVRDPENVFVGKARVIFESLVNAKASLRANLNKEMERLMAGAGKLKPYSSDDQAVGALLHAPLKVRINNKAVTVTHVNLKPGVQPVADAFMDQVGDKLTELVHAGLLNPKKISNARTLADFMPAMVGRGYIPKDVLQSWNLRKAWVMNLRLKDPRAPIPKAENLSAIKSMQDFLYAAQRKLDLEPTLFKYGVKPNPKNEDPITQGLSRWQRRYLTNLQNEITGHGRGRTAIMFDQSVGEFWDKQMQSPLGRLVDKAFRKMGHGPNIDGVTDFSPAMKGAQLMTHNVYRSTMGLNLSFWLRNLSQIVNFPVSKGMPAFFKGALNFLEPDYRDLRKSANLLEDYRSLFDEKMWRTKFGNTYDRILFSGQEGSENVTRGFGFNIGVDEYMKKKGYGSIAALKTAGKAEEALNFGRLESLKGAYTYGVLGRSPVFAHPAMRPMTALLSWAPKTAEFYVREFRKDSTAFLRFIGLHGWLISEMNKHVGIAGEEFLGYGFIPSTKNYTGVPFVASPTGQLALNLLEAAEARKNGDLTTAQRKTEQLWKGLAMGNTLGAAGMNPLPWTEIQDFKRARERWQTRVQEIGADHVDIARKDVIAGYLLGKTTTQKLRENIDNRRRRAENLVQHTVKKRANAFVEAIQTHEGDKLVEATGEFRKPIQIEGKDFYIDPEQFEDAITRAMIRKRVSKDYLELNKSKFLTRLYIESQLELLERTRRE